MKCTAFLIVASLAVASASSSGVQQYGVSAYGSINGFGIPNGFQNSGYVQPSIQQGPCGYPGSGCAATYVQPSTAQYSQFYNSNPNYASNLNYGAYGSINSYPYSSGVSNLNYAYPYGSGVSNYNYGSGFGNTYGLVQPQYTTAPNYGYTGNTYGQYNPVYGSNYYGSNYYGSNYYGSNSNYYGSINGYPYGSGVSNYNYGSVGSSYPVARPAPSPVTVSTYFGDIGLLDNGGGLVLNDNGEQLFANGNVVNFDSFSSGIDAFLQREGFSVFGR